MKRETAIKLLLRKIKIPVLKCTCIQFAQSQPRNYSLKLLHTVLNLSIDSDSNWFTSFGVLCVHQSPLAKRILQQANIESGNLPLTNAEKKELIDAISMGAKLTKADAG